MKDGSRALKPIQFCDAVLGTISPGVNWLQTRVLKSQTSFSLAKIVIMPLNSKVLSRIPFCVTLFLCHFDKYGTNMYIGRM